MQCPRSMGKDRGPINGNAPQNDTAVLDVLDAKKRVLECAKGHLREVNGPGRSVGGSGSFLWVQLYLSDHAI